MSRREKLCIRTCPTEHCFLRKRCYLGEVFPRCWLLRIRAYFTFGWRDVPPHYENMMRVKE